MSVNHSASAGGIIFLIFFNMKVFCVFSLESPFRGNSNEYTQYTILNISKKITLNNSKFAANLQLKSNGIFPRDSKNEFEIAVVNEPSVFIH